MSNNHKDKKSSSSYNWFLKDAKWDADEVAQRKAELFFNAINLKENDRLLLIIDDTYNANPLSVRIALANLALMNREGTTVAVLGEMKELGDYQREGHITIGQITADEDIDYLIPVGSQADLIAEGALERGMNPSKVKICETNDEAVQTLGDLLTNGAWVLFKGSRAAGVEKIMEAFLHREPSTKTGGA